MVISLTLVRVAVTAILLASSVSCRRAPENTARAGQEPGGAAPRNAALPSTETTAAEGKTSPATSAARAMKAPPPERGDVNYPSVLATYEWSGGGQTTAWELLRTPEHITMRWPQEQSAELWTWPSNGELRHAKIFHNKKIVVEYARGDLLALDLHPSWYRLSRLVDHPPAKTLISKGETKSPHGKAIRYESEEPPLLSVVWLPDYQLPAELRRTHGKAVQTLTLKALKPVTTPGPVGSFVGYEHLDYTDLGDNEAHPKIREILHSLGQRLPGVHAH